MPANKRTGAGALLTILAPPITIVAALSGKMAPHLGTSQGALLMGDAVAGAAIVLFVLISKK